MARLPWAKQSQSNVPQNGIDYLQSIQKTWLIQLVSLTNGLSALVRMDCHCLALLQGVHLLGLKRHVEL